MRLFLDTEFNEFGGELISMALVAEDGSEWYEVLPLPEKPGAWVAEHVLPLLDRLPVDGGEFCQGLWNFIRQFPNCQIFADWPADFEHLSNHLARIGKENAWCIPIECEMHLILTPDLKPGRPHNALSDARALRDWYLRTAAIAA